MEIFCSFFLQVSAYMNNWSLVLSYVNRAEGTPEIAQPQSASSKEQIAQRQRDLSKLKCAAGLSELANKKYKAAARNFLLAQFDHLDFPEVFLINCNSN